MSNPAVVDRQMADIDFSQGMSEEAAWEHLDWTKFLRQAVNVDFDVSGKAKVRRGWVSPVGFETSNTIIYGGGTAGALTPIGRLLSTDSGVLAVAAQSATNISRLYQMDETGGGTIAGAWSAKNRLSEYSVRAIPVSGASSDGSTGGVAIGGTYFSQAVETTCYYAVATSSLALPAVTHHKLVLIDKNSNNVCQTYIVEDATNGTMVMSAVGDLICMFVSNGANVKCVQWVVSDQSNLPQFYSYSFNTSVGGTPVACVPDTATSTVVMMTSNGNMSRVGQNTESAFQVGVTPGVTITDMAICQDGTRNLVAVGLDGVSFAAKQISPAFALTGTLAYGAAAKMTANSCFYVAANTTTDFRVVACYRAPANTGAAYTSGCMVIKYNGGYTNIATQAGGGCAGSPFYNTTTSEYYGPLVDLPQAGLGVGHDRAAVAGNVVLVNMSDDLPWGGLMTIQPNALHVSAILDRHVDLAYNKDHGGMEQPVCKPFTFDSGKTWVMSAIEKLGPTATGIELRRIALNDMTRVGISANTISGGKVHAYDGLNASEHGFVVTPCVIAGTPFGGAGVAAGTYNYIVVFEHVDNQGRRHFSKCSNPLTVVLAGPNTVPLNISFPVWTDHASFNIRGSGAYNYHLKLHVYRTTSGGTQYYRIGTWLPASVAASNQDFLVITDTMVDATLQTKELMHRQPGTAGTSLDRYAGLSAACVRRHKDRIFYARGSTIYYSSFDVYGEAPWFNPAFSIVVPDGAGDIIALGSMDGVLVVFKESGIFVIDGDGPPENGGSGSEFTPPRKLMCETGCIDQRSVVHTNEGIIFRSNLGLEILRRNLSVDFIGAAVQDTMAANPYSGGAAYDSASGRCAWVVGSGQGTYPGIIATAGLAVVYDTQQKSWTTYTKSGIVVQDVANAIVGSSFASIPQSRKFVFADSARAHMESGGVDSVAGTNAFIPITLVTGYIKTNSKQDRVRVSDFYIGGKYKSPFNMTVQYSTDYNDGTFTTVKTWTRYGDLIASAPVPQFEVNPPKELVQSMAFKITTSDPTPSALGNGQQMDIFALTAKAGIKGGGVKLVSTQKG